MVVSTQALEGAVARALGGTISAEVEKRAAPRVDDVVGRAQRGDMMAFEQLYRDHADRVYALCLRMSADTQRAEELTQDVFVRLWEKIGSYRGDAAFSTWLHRMTVNVVLGQRRSEGRRRQRITVTDDLSSYEQPSTTTPGTGIDLEAAIQTLPPGARNVFVLHDVEGYRHGEIAKMTGQAEGTSKAQLPRARKLLRKALNR